MASWAEIAYDAPEFAARVRRRFDVGTNKTLATLCKDGSPRISANEITFTNSDITLGMMPGSMKLLDVRRDPRTALHSPTVDPTSSDPSEWGGEAKLAGRLVGIEGPTEGPFAGSSFFRVDIREVALTYVGTTADHLVIESWHTSRGWSRRTRA